MVKNLPAVQETGFDPWVRKIPWRTPWTEEPGGLYTVHGVSKSWIRLSD